MQRVDFIDQSAMGEVLATDNTEIHFTRPAAKVIYHAPVNGVDVHEIPWPPKLQAQEP